MKTIAKVIEDFLDNLTLSRSENTAKTYRNGLNIYAEVLTNHGLDVNTEPISSITEDTIAWLTTYLKNHAPTTERLYLTAATQFFEFLSAEKLIPVNLSRIRLLIKQRARKPGQRLPQFPRNAIEEVLAYADTLVQLQSDKPKEQLRNLRDRAFLLMLADTGLRVHEACNLRRGDIDWNESKAIVIGKGNREAVVRFSRRSLSAINKYLSVRASIDGTTGKPLGSLPLFARHDKGVGKRIEPITTTTGRNIVSQRVIEALGTEASGTITPHSFRHYFVTTVLRASGNLKMAQELARHQNIAVTTRYAHLSDDELDEGYYEIFDR